MACVRRSVLLAGAVFVLVPLVAAAQLYYRPQPRPLVTAEHDSWFLAGEPITHEGYVYYAAGPRVYFNGDVMVRTGSYRGVPLYADTTREPYSIVLVPVAGGLMQPYERRRTGDAAGGTATQAPSFPVDIAGEDSEWWRDRALPATPGPPVWNDPDELVFDRQMGDAAAASARRAGTSTTAHDIRATPEPGPVATHGAVAPKHVVEAGLTPKGLNEIYVVYSGLRWRSAGPAVAMRVADYERIGDYHGRPVYRSVRDSDEERIFLEGCAGFIAPYHRAGKPVRY